MAVDLDFKGAIHSRAVWLRQGIIHGRCLLIGEVEGLVHERWYLSSGLRKHLQVAFKRFCLTLKETFTHCLDVILIGGPLVYQHLVGVLIV